MTELKDKVALIVGAGSGLSASIARVFAKAGMPDALATTLTVRVSHASFEHWWNRFTLGVGPAGAYLTSLDADRRARLRERCRRLMPAGPVEVFATAWAVVSRT